MDSKTEDTKDIQTKEDSAIYQQNSDFKKSLPLLSSLRDEWQMEEEMLLAMVVGKRIIVPGRHSLSGHGTWK